MGLSDILKNTLGINEEKDPLFEDAIKIVTQYDRASASLLQRRLSIGYSRAARLIDQLTTDGIIGEGDRSRPRDVICRSYEEYFLKKSNPQVKTKQEEENDIYEIPKYELPDFKLLTKPKKLPWGLPLKKVLQDPSFNKPLAIPVGYYNNGEIFTANLSELGNLLIVGNSASNKMVFVDTLLSSLLFNSTPVNLRTIIIDHTHYLDLFQGIPHLLTPIISDLEKAFSALKWSVAEMDRRVKLLSQVEIRTIEKYNEMSGFQALPQIVIVINRVNDLISYSPEFADTLKLIVGYGLRSGVSVILISDRLSEKDLPASIKSNISNRVVFSVSNATDSKLADVKSAENLKPDELLFKNSLNPNGLKLKAVYTSEDNIKEIVKFIIRTVAAYKKSPEYFK